MTLLVILTSGLPGFQDKATNLYHVVCVNNSCKITLHM